MQAWQAVFNVLRDPYTDRNIKLTALQLVEGPPEDFSLSLSLSLSTAFFSTTVQGGSLIQKET